MNLLELRWQHWQTSANAKLAPQNRRDLADALARRGRAPNIDAYASWDIIVVQLQYKVYQSERAVALASTLRTQLAAAEAAADPAMWSIKNKLNWE